MYNTNLQNDLFSIRYALLKKTEHWEESVLSVGDYYLNNLWRIFTVEKYTVKNNDMSVCYFGENLFNIQC